MKTFLLSFDVEQLPSKEWGLPIDEGTAFEVGDLGLKKIMGLLETAQKRATFFVTAEFAERFAHSVRMLVRRGHEVAFHGVRHEHAYHLMEPDVAQNMLLRARIAMEKRFNTPVVGFRGPQMSRPSYKVLAACGFAYDSSLHPTYIPGKYNSFTAPRHVHKRQGITIVPVSVTPHLRLPFSWLWFRRIGPTYARVCAMRSLSDTGFLHLYFHPWEFVEPPVQPGGLWQKLIFGGCGSRNLDRLKRFIAWAEEQQLEAMTISEFLSRKD